MLSMHYNIDDQGFLKTKFTVDFLTLNVDVVVINTGIVEHNPIHAGADTGNLEGGGGGPT